MRSAASFLVLGGTSWLGSAVAGEANRRGHDVTCLARGQSGSAPDGVRWVAADRRRRDAYARVRDRDWDAVLDVSWQPDLVAGAVDALGRRAAHWTYVSSLSVYADDSATETDESAMRHPARTATGEATSEEYAGAKVACEDLVIGGLGPERVFLPRPGLIVGHGDRSDRFGYWPARLARVGAAGERVLVPPLAAAVQVIDVVDLARWLVDAAEEHGTGAFNAVGDVVRFADVFAECATAAGVEPVPVEPPAGWLAAHGVAPWDGPESLPLWLPEQGYDGFMRRRNDAAKAAGLRLRPLRETIADALAWERQLGVDRSRTAGLTPIRERELLADLRSTGAPSPTA
jgi:2'-hydroxyisoflavone reductase